MREGEIRNSGIPRQTLCCAKRTLRVDRIQTQRLRTRRPTVIQNATAKERRGVRRVDR
jgi:hypothetical protein